MKETNKNIPELIEEGKAACVKAYGQERAWSHAYIPHEGWPDGSQDVELYVMVGSPAKGIVLVNHGRGDVRAFDVTGKRVYHGRRL